MINNIDIKNEICSFDYSGKISILNCIRQSLLTKNIISTQKLSIMDVKTNLIYLICEIQRTFDQIYVNNTKYSKINPKTFKLKINNSTNKNIIVKSKSIEFYDSKKVKTESVLRNDLVLFILLPEQYINIKGKITKSDESYVCGYFQYRISNFMDYDNLKNIKCKFNTYDIYPHKKLLLIILNKIINSLEEFGNIKNITKKNGEWIINSTMISESIQEPIIILLVDALNEIEFIKAGYKSKHILLNEHIIKIISDNSTQTHENDIKNVIKKCVTSNIAIYKKLIKQI